MMNLFIFGLFIKSYQKINLRALHYIVISLSETSNQIRCEVIFTDTFSQIKQRWQPKNDIFL